MKTAIIIVLLMVTAIQAAQRYTLERGLRQAAEKMRAQMADETTTRLALPCPSAGAEELLVCLNDLLELRQRERADYRRKEQALRQQIANVSHDLRTPLTSILGYLQLLEGGLSPEKRQEYFQVIEGRARTLQTFIASFYDLSRIEGGELPLEREKVDLGRALSDQLAAAYEQIEETGLAMEVDIASSLPPVWADSSAVTRIFPTCSPTRYATVPIRCLSSCTGMVGILYPPSPTGRTTSPPRTPPMCLSDSIPPTKCARGSLRVWGWPLLER